MRGERIITYDPGELEIWDEDKEPRLHIHMGEPFKPFQVEDFTGRNLINRDFFIGQSFTLEGFGVGAVHYLREYFLGFEPGWAQENAITPFGSGTVAYQFSLGLEATGIVVPPLEMTVMLLGRTACYPPDYLVEFPSEDKAILGRWKRRVYDPDFHRLPIVYHRQYILPDWQEFKSLYLPEDPRILSDLTLTFLATEPNLFCN